MKKAILIIVSQLSLVFTQAFAQIPELTHSNVIPPSPVASELTKYITYPVDLCNGLVKTSIPLYEIVDGDIRIPITLNYHASGLKPNMRSSHWLGDGWSLSTGPSLSRTINGVADEIKYLPELALRDSLSYEQLNAIYTQAVDVALDEFHYSLPGSSGRLYLRRDIDGTVTPVTIPRDDIIVTFSGGKSLREFCVKDNFGMTYSFGGTDRSYYDYVYYEYGTGPSSSLASSAWKIREIRSATTGRTVSFKYTSNIEEIFCMRYVDALTILDEYVGQSTCTIPLVDVSNCQSNERKLYVYDRNKKGLVEADLGVVQYPVGYRFPMPARQKIIQENSYVQRIDFSGGHILFNMNADKDKGLESIEVYDLSGKQVKRVKFVQTYCETNFSLRLESLEIESPNGNASETYSFTYKGDCPPRDTRSIDKWGYYNGRNNSTLVPTVTTYVSVRNYPLIGYSALVTVPGGDRNPDEEAMQRGILTSVTYPTGGRTEFSYEAHRYIDDNGKSRMAGGLRIKQIRDIAGDGKILYRNFSYSTYSSTINGGGVRTVIPQDSSYPPDTMALYYRETNCAEFGGTLPSLLATYKERVWMDNMMVSLISDAGSSVNYPYVFETRSSDAAGNHTIGLTVHAYVIVPDRPMQVKKTNLIYDDRQEWRSGVKTGETVYKHGTDGMLQKVSEVQSDYSNDYDFGSDSTAIRQRYVYRSWRPYGLDDFHVPEQYKEISYITTTLSQGRRRPRLVNETVIGDNGSVTKTTTFTYDARGNVREKKENVGLPEYSNRITTYTYPQDKAGGVYSAMSAAGMTGVPVETSVYKNSVNDANLLTTLSISYGSYPCASGTFFAPSAKSLMIRGASSSERKILFNEYDRRGNPLEAEDTEGRKTVYLWGYNGYYPVAMVKGGDWNSVKNKVDTSGLNDGDFTQIRKKLVSFRLKCRDVPDMFVNTYEYKPLVGLSYLKSQSGSIFDYEYDGLGRLCRTFVRNGTTHEKELLSSYSYSYGPSAGGNRIRTRDYLGADAASFKETNTYHDLLGRPVETVMTAASPAGKDIALLSEYDDFGRPYRKFCPVPMTTSTGAYASFSDIHPEILKFYNWEVYAFSKTLYDDSPLDRPVEEYGPGSPWHTRGKSVKTAYLVNEDSGLLSCSGYLVESDTSLTCVGTLPSGNLNVVKVTDEDGNVSLTFTDKLGHKALERTVDGERYQDIYYVYDDLGLLRYVLTPEASAVMSSSGTFGDSSSPLSAQAYVYKYDGKGRCVSKRLPGCAPILYRYDKGDVPIFSQDGEMRKRGKWMFSFRDLLGREAVSGVWPLQNAPSSVEIPAVATYSGSTWLGGYSLNIPIPPNNRPLSVNYYDDYSFMNDLVTSDTKQVLSCDTLSNYGIPVVGSDRCKGLLTGTAVYSLTDPTSKTVSSFYYDYQGRLIQSHRKEALGGAGHIHQSLTFTGKPSMTRETVALPDGRIDSLVTVRSYDGQERLVSETTSLNGRSQSVSYGYDEIGRMTGRIYGTEANPSTLTETLSYNIRDQLTGLNSSVFSMTLRYQEPTLGSVPKYNGGISEWEWNHGAGAETNAWSLSYDGVGRLTDARRFVSGVQTNSFSERSITYDRNSNALTLTRYGENAATPEEILAYSYDGNLLSGISNTGASGGGGQYTHDANGNMTHEGLSGLDIVYNEQNLTRRISSGGTTLAEYEYLADGSKLRALDGGGNGYQYRGSLIYTQTAGQSDSPVITLDCALTSAGRIARETSAAGTVSYRPLIHLRDHLGSVRAVIDGDTGTVVETSDYYPFGKRIQVTAPVSEPVEGAQHAAEPAVAPVATATSVASTSSPNRWRFSGKESQSFLYASIPLLDFGARMYNPAIARWTAADPLSEDYHGVSPYAYCVNSPMTYVDSDGRIIHLANNYAGGIENIARISVTSLGSQVISHLIQSNDVYTLNSKLFTTDSGYDSNNLNINYVGNPWRRGLPVDGGSFNSMLAMGHELFHAYDHSNRLFNSSNAAYRKDIIEPRAVSFANYLRQSYSLLPLRERYGNIKGNFHQFAGNESISDFTKLGNNQDKTSYGFSYTKTTTIVESYKSFLGIKIPDKTRKETISYYMIVSRDKNNNVSVHTYSDENEYKKVASNW